MYLDINRVKNSNLEEGAISLKKMSHDQYVLEASISAGYKKQLELKPSTSRCFPTRKSSRNHTDIDKKAAIKRLEGRLGVLEEEAEMLKRDLLETLEERTKLMSEISGYLETIQHFLLKREVEKRDFDANGVQITSLKEEGRAGLLQVLCQESNPTLVNRAFRANALAYD